MLIILRRDVEAAWEEINPVLRPRELCTVTDRAGAKLGDGERAYSDLDFLAMDQLLQALVEGIEVWL